MRSANITFEMPEGHHVDRVKIATACFEYPRSMVETNDRTERRLREQLFVIDHLETFRQALAAATLPPSPGNGT